MFINYGRTGYSRKCVYQIAQKLNSELPSNVKRCFAMKIICILIIGVWFRPVLNMEMQQELKEFTPFCNAIKSIIKLVILLPPINIQIIDENFGKCIESKNSTVLINVCMNSVPWMSQSSLIIAKEEVEISKLIHLCMNHNGNHLVVLHKNSKSHLNDLVNYFWKKLLINVSFLVINKSEILIQTFIPYNDRKCNDTELETINRFDERSGNWKTDKFFPKKLNNFHRCFLTVTTYKNVVPYIVHEEYINGKMQLKGRVIQMIDALATSLNFTTKLEYEPSVAAWEKCIDRVANYEADLFIGNLVLDLSRTKYLDFTIPIFFETLKFVIPPGRPYTQIENLTRAFDITVWYMILCVFLLTALGVLILSGRSKNVKIYAFGIGYRNAFMDFLGTVFGVTGTSMPDLNIPRIIIIKFVIFCFVIRTVYQGSLFNFLQSNGKLKPAQSIDDMINRGYTFYMLALYDNYLNAKRHDR